MTCGSVPTRPLMSRLCRSSCPVHILTSHSTRQRLFAASRERYQCNVPQYEPQSKKLKLYLGFSQVRAPNRSPKRGGGVTKHIKKNNRAGVQGEMLFPKKLPTKSGCKNRYFPRCQLQCANPCGNPEMWTLWATSHSRKFSWQNPVLSCLLLKTKAGKNYKTT